MAGNVQRTGKVDIMIQTPDISLTDLGEAEDMVDVSERGFYHNVPGDAHGGPQGPPIEIQYLGSIAVIRFKLSRFIQAAVDNIRDRAVRDAGTLGEVADEDIGDFMLGTRWIRLLLKTTTEPRNFPCCIAREPIGYAMGTKYQGVDFQFEAHRGPPNHPNPGILFNETIT